MRLSDHRYPDATVSIQYRLSVLQGSFWQFPAAPRNAIRGEHSNHEAMGNLVDGDHKVQDWSPWPFMAREMREMWGAVMKRRR